MKQKKYNIFKNSKYAFEGLITLLKEKAFLIELSIIIPLLIWLIFAKISTIQKSIMTISLFIVLITEAINTAIEYSVDLATTKWHPLAKKAKDTASAAVLLSIIQAIIIWIIQLL
jgi:diacylglycerol kinase